LDHNGSEKFITLAAKDSINQPRITFASHSPSKSFLPSSNYLKRTRAVPLTSY
jgi:hypothetical protein